MSFRCLSIPRLKLGRRNRVLAFFLCAAGALALVPVAMFLWARPVQAAHEDPPEREAWYLVRQRCYLCHFIDSNDPYGSQSGTKYGPSLKELFSDPNATLLNGEPLNEQTVSAWITNGGAGMPAFKYTLNARQIHLIFTYLSGGFPNAPRQDGTYGPGAKSK